MYPNPVRVSGMTGEATKGQIEYAERIYLLLGAEKPRERTKQAYSDYINRYAKRYKQALQEVAV